MATKITEKLTINGDQSSVVLDGLDFTGNGYVEVKNADEVIIRNCRVYNMNVTGVTKNFWLRIFNDIPVKLVVEHCFFGSNPSADGKRMYNLIEPYAKFKNGSSISHNYFADDCCVHNCVNVYGVVDNATINIDDNVFEISAGTVRLGPKGEPKCTINVRDNVILADNPAYTAEDQGLLTIQPYNKDTTSLKNMTVVLKNNTLASEQVGYFGYGANDLVITDENKAKIIINGKIATLPTYQW